MGYRFDNLRLEKGMYNEAGRSFTQVLEREDPSEQYKGTALEGLDAYQRQLKRFDIKVKGAGSDAVEKFFATSQSAVLFPEYIARSVRQGMEEANLEFFKDNRHDMYVVNNKISSLVGNVKEFKQNIGKINSHGVDLSAMWNSNIADWRSSFLI